MIEQFFLKPSPEKCEENKLIFTAVNGQGYMTDDKLHIYGNYHLIYNFEVDKMGWYMMNPKDNKEWYLGVGASPSVLIEDINIIDLKYFESLLIVRDKDEVGG